MTSTLLVLSIMMALAWPAAGQTKATGETLAEVDGVPIKAQEIDRDNALGIEISKLQEQIYQLRLQKLEALIGDRLLAKEAAKRGISVEALLAAEVTSKAGQVTDQEVDAFYQANKARLGGEEAFLRQQIRTYLQNQKLAAQRQSFLQSLRSQAKIVVHLKRPPVFRAEVPVDGAPVRGPAMAPVTIVEVSDFHCPFCKQVQSTLKQVLERYGDKVKLVYRDFPIDSLHPGARTAAEAARCANDQGKFWAYHDKLYAGPPDASPEKLKALGAEVGLDLAAFEQCLSSGKHKARVQKDVEEANRLGVNGTPAFFINGRMLPGAQPLENFVSVIEEELARARSGS